VHCQTAMKKISIHVAQQLVLILLFAPLAFADYGLLLNSFRGEEAARTYANSITRQNQQVIVEKIEMPGSGIWYRTCVGPFATKVEALKQRNAMRLDGYKGDIIVVQINPANVIPSKMSAPEKISPAKFTPPPSPATGTVTIEWSGSKDPALAGYKIYYGTNPGPPYAADPADSAEEGPSPVRVGRDVTKLTLHGLNGSKKYFFAITSLNKNNIESAYSKEIAAIPESGGGKVHDIVDAQPQPVPVRAETVSRASAAPAKAADDAKTAPASMKETAGVHPSPSVKSQPPTYKRSYRKPLESPPPATAPSLPSKAGGGESLVAPGDILRIEVPGQKEMSFDYDVDPDGNIYMLMIGKVPVRGVSETALSDTLTKEAKQFIAKGERVSAKILDRKRYIYIRGGVRCSGWYRVPSKISVENLLAMSGGALCKEAHSGVTLHRKVGGEDKKFSVQGTITLHPNDIITVPMPKIYRKEADKGDLMFISIPQRQAPGRRPDTTDSADLTQSLAQNKIEIDRNGYIYIPNYGHVFVNNLTTEEIKKEIESRLPKYIAVLNQVEVSIIEKRHYVQVLGHVTNPGWYNVPETANIQEVVSVAGGAVDGAAMSDVVIQRNMNGSTAKVEVNLHQFTITGDGRLLTPIQENDVVFVPISSNFGNVKRTLMAWAPPQERLEKDVKEKVRIFGAVRNPGIYEVEEDMTLVDLLVLASGEDQYAELTDIAIIRNGKVITRFDLEEFLHGKAKGGTRPLPSIQGGDTVYVTRIETKDKEAQDRVYVVGKVLRPGSYELYDDMTVLQGLAWAGGLNEWADSDNIMIVRMVDGKQQNIPFNYDKGVRGREPEVNIRLAPNDTIVVP